MGFASGGFGAVSTRNRLSRSAGRQQQNQAQTGREAMRFMHKLALGIAVAVGLSSAAAAQTRVVFVTHGQSGDPYWSVVKNGMDDAAKSLGVKAEYLAPETFDMAKMGQMIDAIAASKPDGMVVSIPDAAALTTPVKNAV